MKTIYKLTLLFSIISVSLFALTACSNNATLTDHRTVIGETYTLEDGRILDGNLNVIGGVVAIKETASVNGNVFVLGGLVTIDGTIKGDLTANRCP
jgi:cytoskeletal protein CcmA (bactofilin family)